MNESQYFNSHYSSFIPGLGHLLWTSTYKSVKLLQIWVLFIIKNREKFVINWGKSIAALIAICCVCNTSHKSRKDPLIIIAVPQDREKETVKY